MRLEEERLKALDDALADLDGQRGYVPVASTVLTSLLAEIRSSRILLEKAREYVDTAMRINGGPNGTGQAAKDNEAFLTEIDTALE